MNIVKHLKSGRRLALACAVVAAVSMSVHAGDLPFIETFDDTPDVLLHNYREWQAHQQSDVQAQQAVKYAGTQSAVVATNALLWQNFSDATATNIWLDFYGYQEYPDDNTPPDLQGSVAASFFVGMNGTVYATSNATWVPLSYTVPEGAWRRFTVNLDYSASTWSLYVADEVPNRIATPVAVDLPFYTSSTNTYFRAFKVKN